MSDSSIHSQIPSQDSSTQLLGTILVVDDEKNIRRTLRMVLEGEGATVLEASSAEQALTILDGGVGARPDLMIVDVLLPGMSGIEMLERLSVRQVGDGGDSETSNRRGSLPVPVIVISGHATMSDAVHATRLGAYDFFEKPLSRERIIVSVRNALAQVHAVRQLDRLRRESHGEIIASSPPMRELMATVQKVGRSRARVLIQGESGTGKELVARALHDASDRRAGSFVKVNCAAIPRELIESELFGHEKGAFTGATHRKRGLFEVADQGTLFLDEIGDMDLDAQAKVLRVLQSGEFQRVGGHEAIQVDVRVFAATHRNLFEMTQRGEFREDLYFRLNVVPLQIPPLRERPEDIPELTRHFVALSCRENGLAEKQIDEACLELLANYTWPGNVRELRNVVERMVVLSDGELTQQDLPREFLSSDQGEGGSKDHDADQGLGSGVLSGLEELPSLIGRDGSDLPLRDFREAVERAYILKRLDDLDWNVSRTAEALGVERTHLHRKLKLLGIQRGR